MQQKYECKTCPQLSHCPRRTRPPSGGSVQQGLSDAMRNQRARSPSARRQINATRSKPRGRPDPAKRVAACVGEAAGRVDPDLDPAGTGRSGRRNRHRRDRAVDDRPVRVHGVRRRRLTQLQADGDGCARRGRGRPSAGRHGGQRPGNQTRRHGARDGREYGLVHELPQVHALAQAGLMNAEATRQELVAAQ